MIEPARHGRFQQWQLSGHANYDLAMSRGASGSCASCHSSQGFAQWVKESGPGGDFDQGIEADLADIGLSADTAMPQGCVSCHDPHKQGQSSGEPNTATVRVYGDTAINSGYYTFSYEKDGQPTQLPARYSFALVKRDGKWLIVDHHSSTMPK